MLSTLLLIAASTPGPPLPPPTSGPPPLTAADVLSLPDRMKPDAGTFGGWIDDDAYVLRAPSPPPARDVYYAVDAATGARRPIFEPADLARALERGGVPAPEAAAWSEGEVTFVGGHRGVLLERANDLHLWWIGEDAARRLTHDDAPEVGVTPSPDGRYVAFLRGANLYVVGTDGAPERSLTSEGGGDLLLGRLDWVYQEELYGRGNWQGFFWSPDSRRIAFLALDESGVPPYTIVDHRKTRPDVEVWRYPKAGDPNPVASLKIVDVVGGEARTADLSAYAHDEKLLVRVGFAPDGREAIVQVQDRVQTWLDVVAVDVESGATRRLFRDETGAWIEPTDAPFWLADGERFLWLSERDGYRHLYLYRRTGDLVRRLTEGPWEVDAVHGVDEAAGVVYATCDVDDVRGAKLCAIQLDGSGVDVITQEGGTHGVSMSPGLRRFRDAWSSLRDPGRVTLHDADGALLREEARGSLAPLDPYGVSAPELVKVPLADGGALEAMLFKPPGFDPSRRYPVMCYAYGGPHAPQVLDRYFNRHRMFHHALQQRGYLVWICDNRSASGKGLASQREIHRNLGEAELRDQLLGLDWLVGRRYVDESRIGLWGWSYGGFLTAYALTRSARFKMGIVGAPVTDWRFYDSIYTERYMDTPQANPEGYARSSILPRAKDLHGQMLLIHGTIDENVHLQNSFQFVEALQRAGKRFDLMVYPGNRHSVRDPAQQEHLYGLMADYVFEHL